MVIVPNIKKKKAHVLKIHYLLSSYNVPSHLKFATIMKAIHPIPSTCLDNAGKFCTIKLKHAFEFPPFQLDPREKFRVLIIDPREGIELHQK